MDSCLELARSDYFTLYRQGDTLVLDVLVPPVPVLGLLGFLRHHADPDEIDLEKVRRLASSGGKSEIGYVSAELSSERPSLKIVEGGGRCVVTLPAGFADGEELDRFLASKGVIHGIDREAIASAILESSSGQTVLNRTIARGTPPVNGEDGWIEYLKDRPSGRPMQDESGEVDIYSLELVTTVEKGDVLAVRHNPSSPTEGRTVCGKSIPGKAGKSPRVVYGKGVELLDDRLVASTFGQLIWRGERMSVEPLLEIKGDVGPETGNVRYNGTVLVHGDVLDGFSLEAEGDVEIRGCVERATVRSKGNISVRYGVAGKGVGVIEAEGNVLAKFVQESEIRCAALKVNEYILRSKVFARRGVMVDGKQGVVMSSRIEARSHVNVRSIQILKEEDSSIAITGISRAALFSKYRQLQSEDEKDADRMMVLSASIRTLSEKGLFRQATTRLAEFVSLEEAVSRRRPIISEIKETLRNLKGDASLTLVGKASGSLSVRLKGVPCRLENGARWMTMYFDPDEGRVRVVGRG